MTKKLKDIYKFNKNCKQEYVNKVLFLTSILWGTKYAVVDNYSNLWYYAKKEIKGKRNLKIDDKELEKIFLDIIKWTCWDSKMEIL